MNTTTTGTAACHLDELCPMSDVWGKHRLVGDGTYSFLLPVVLKDLVSPARLSHDLLHLSYAFPSTLTFHGERWIALSSAVSALLGGYFETVLVPTGRTDDSQPVMSTGNLINLVEVNEVFAEQSLSFRQGAREHERRNFPTSLTSPWSVCVCVWSFDLLPRLCCHRMRVLLPT